MAPKLLGKVGFGHYLQENAKSLISKENAYFIGICLNLEDLGVILGYFKDILPILGRILDILGIIAGFCGNSQDLDFSIWALLNLNAGP